MDKEPDHHSNLILASGALIIAFTIAFSAGALDIPARTLQSLQFANVGIGAGAAVPETEFNTLAQKIAEKEDELEEREEHIVIREREIETTRYVATRDQTSLVYTTLVGLLLLSLILLNFILDNRRGRRE